MPTTADTNTPEATTARTTDATGRVWEAPPGSWTSGADHVRTAVTPSMIELYGAARGNGMRRMFETYGFPAGGYDAAFVNGHLYDRLQPLIGADKPEAKLPPKPILWVAMRVHPAFRKRRKTMEGTFAPTRRWEAELRDWNNGERDEWVSRNLALQDVDVVALDDRALLGHLDDVIAHYDAAVTRHFSIKGLDSAPLGDLLALTNDAGIPAAEVVAALRGSSPASAVPPELRAVADALREADVRPKTLDGIRAASPAAANALDHYIRLYGTRIVTGYDIDGRNLIELPDVIVNSVLAVLDHDGSAVAIDTDAIRAEVRRRVPEPLRTEFDDRFRQAAMVYGVRDDNGPLTFQWPVGLVRRVYVEIGRRTAEHGRLHDPEHAVELSVAELRASFEGAADALTPDAVLERARRRAADSLLVPPATLGPEEPPAPLDVMPAVLARSVRAIEAFLASMTGVQEGRQPLQGTGINTEPFEGRAVVALCAEEALVQLEPGDVLIAPCTTPAYNSVLPIVGAVVTEEGGALCHAAVVARELGIPAVVGALHATTKINTGDTVAVDPLKGTVAVV